MVKEDSGWRLALGITIIAFSIFGLGVSVGRFVPTAQAPESLAQKLTHICFSYQNVQSFVLCQTIFAAKFKDRDWTEAALGGVPQERLDAEFLYFISSFVSLENNDFLGEAVCEVAAAVPPAVCSVGQPLAVKTKQAVQIQIQYDASKLIMNRPKQSRFIRAISFLATTSTWIWKLAIFSGVGLTVGNIFGARYFFWPWVCFPWIWFFKDASASYILIWYSLGGFVVYDLGFMQYKISRSLIALFLIAVTCMTWAWFVVKGNREVAFSLFCFLAFAVPLDPFFDWALSYVATTNKAAPIAQ